MSAEELMALNQQLNERIAALEAETRPPQRPKVNRPTPFKGDRPKLRTFLAQMDLYFAANAITRDNDQVLSAATYLEGTALDWFEPRLRSWFHETPEERDVETNAIFNSYAEFVKRLKITFGDTDEKVSAAQRLNRLNQKGSAAHYASEFQQISSHLEKVMSGKLRFAHDDVIIFTKDTREDHAEKVKLVLKKLSERQLFLKLKKCEFFKKELMFLGHIISTEGIKMDPEKIKAIQEWPTPKVLHDG
ncbi:Retrotransposon gag protein [Ascosphaera apis ARSEF 7405]|uniref:Retrotransposon gag protein n=1 Tax=Ascosphaera apis ARSEF 7405 TaxID=392613 RepID=A0A166PIZ3_9EURO|nr:Retrotransposon gag protein [Ascosphaera apis ARSEF 7405]